MTDRPLPPDTLKHFLGLKAEMHEGHECSPKQLGLLAGMLTECLSGDKQSRYAVTEWLTGQTSLNDLDDEMLLAMLDWMTVEQGEHGYRPSEYAIKEAQAVLIEALKAQGQQEMFGEMEY